MTPVVSREEMRRFDADAIARGVPGIVLMENAGANATDVLVRAAAAWRESRWGGFHVVCGTGNNGGDGFVVARHLLVRGESPRVWIVGERASVRGDAALALSALLAVRPDIVMDLSPANAAIAAEQMRDGVLVDAVFGTGLDRPIAGAHAALFEVLNRASVKRVAIDLPSGLDANTGQVLGVALRADLTVTFGFLKRGLCTPSGAGLAGEVVVVPIGIPSVLDAPLAENVEDVDVRALLPRRGPRDHKHSVGHVAIFGGSVGKSGAALLAARAALRAGAGAATVVTWPEVVDALAQQMPEIMFTPLEAGDVANSVTRGLANKRGVVVGPGFGIHESARMVLLQVLRHFAGPIVLDADALTLLAEKRELPPIPAGQTRIVTPHVGEASRLLRCSAAEIEGDRFRSVQELARSASGVALLKGAHTLVSTGERIWVLPRGTPTAAAAGSGDVLSGMAAAFACSMPPESAAYAAALVHLRAAESWSRRVGSDRGILAGELADEIPNVLGLGASLVAR